MLKLLHNSLISHTSKVMLKSLQARLQQYVSRELPDVQASFRKDRGTRDQIANILLSKKQESSRKTSISALLTMPKPLTVWITINCGTFWKRWNTNHLTCLLRNLYAGREATVRTGHGTTDWFQIGKGVLQGCVFSPCLLTSMESTSWETLGWKKHKLESRLPGEISITSYIQIILPLWQKVKRNWKASWWK